MESLFVFTTGFLFFSFFEMLYVLPLSRLMNCSDSHLAYVCIECGDILNVFADISQESTFAPGFSCFCSLPIFPEINL
jgi:hypothetical protein